MLDNPALILNVDGDDVSRDATTHILQQAGYRVLEAGTGADALRQTREFHPDFILLDTHLPDISGIEVTRTLKADPATQRIPILYLTETVGDSEHIAEMLATGADNYLAKPVAPGVLLAMIGALLRNSTVQRELSETKEQLSAHAEELETMVEELRVAHEDLQSQEQARQVSEVRFRTAVDHLPVVYVLYDRQLRILFMNQAGLDRFGLTEAQVIGHTDAQFVPQEVRRTYLPALLRTRATKCRQSFEATQRLPKGTWTLAYDCVPLLDEQGEVYQILSIATDITKRKQAEEVLRKESRLITLAHRIIEVFVKETGDGLYDKVLDILLEGMKSRHGVFGYIDEQGDLVCPTMSKLFDECEMAEKCIHYTRDKWKGLWSRALIEQKTFYTNEPSEVPTGHVAIQNNLATPILFQGRAIGLINLANKEDGYTDEDREFVEAVANRIAPTFYAQIQKELRESERKQAEAALLESEEKYRLLAEALPVTVWMCDVEGQPIYANAYWHELTGLSLEESALGRDEERHHPEDFAKVQATWKEGERTGQGFTTEFRWRRNPAEEYRWLWGRVVPLKDTQGTVTHWLSVLTDVTERKQAEEALQAAQQARAELAEQLNHEINHRVKNNLAMLAGIISLSATEQEDPQARAILQETEARLRTFAGVYEQLQAVLNEDVDLLAILKEVAQANRLVFGTTKVEAEVSGDATVLPVKAATNLAVVANELFTNAVKHGSQMGEVPLHVIVELACKEGMLCLRLWNSGAAPPDGFDLAAQRGLGLRLVRDLASQYGGSFTLGSGEGGTVAQVCVPLATLTE